MTTRRRARLLIGALTAVSLLGTGVPAAQAQERPQTAARKIAEQVTGAPVRDLRSTETIHGYAVAPGRTKHGGARTMVQARQDGFSVMAVLSEGESSATFPNALPAGQRLEADEHGGFRIMVGTKPVGRIEPPWAVDARGRRLPTHYRLQGDGSLVQAVDTAGATFPVVADPSYRFGWYRGLFVVYERLTWSEMWRFKILIRRHGAEVNTAISGLCTIVGSAIAAAACATAMQVYYAHVVRLVNKGIRTKTCLRTRYPLYPTPATVMWAYNSRLVRCLK